MKEDLRSEHPVPSIVLFHAGRAQYFFTQLHIELRRRGANVVAVTPGVIEKLTITLSSRGEKTVPSGVLALDGQWTLELSSIHGFFFQRQFIFVIPFKGKSEDVAFKQNEFLGAFRMLTYSVRGTVINRLDPNFWPLSFLGPSILRRYARSSNCRFTNTVETLSLAGCSETTPLGSDRDAWALLPFSGGGRILPIEGHERHASERLSKKIPVRFICGNIAAEVDLYVVASTVIGGYSLDASVRDRLAAVSVSIGEDLGIVFFQVRWLCADGGCQLMGVVLDVDLEFLDCDVADSICSALARELTL